MILFPWLVAALLLLALAAVIAALPPRVRTVRSRGAEPFVHPSLVAVAVVALALVLALAVWFVLLGPPD